jgi:alpha-beta hydrolase superfamily lysophospholipase
MQMRSLKRIGKGLLYTAGALAAAYVGSSIVMGWMLVRPSKRRRYDSIARVRDGRLEAIQLVTSDGLRLHGWVLLSQVAPPSNWVILLHGYRSDRIASHRRARFFARRGYNVLLLHFRGHGGSQAARISYGYHERKDVHAAFQFLRSLHPEARARIGIVGRSMGAAAAAYAVGAGEIDPDWLILESCYDNIRHALANRLAQHIGEPLVPWLAWPLELVVEQLVDLRAEDLDPAKALTAARCPILVMAGDSEKVLKPVEIEYLYGCINAPKKLAIFPGAGHEDLLAFDPRRYVKVVRDFLQHYHPPFPVIDCRRDLSLSLRPHP